MWWSIFHIHCNPRFSMFHLDPHDHHGDFRWCVPRGMCSWFSKLEDSYKATEQYPLRTFSGHGLYIYNIVTLLTESLVEARFHLDLVKGHTNIRAFLDNSSWENNRGLIHITWLISILLEGVSYRQEDSICNQETLAMTTVLTRNKEYTACYTLSLEKKVGIYL